MSATRSDIPTKGEKMEKTLVEKLLSSHAAATSSLRLVASTLDDLSPVSGLITTDPYGEPSTLTLFMHDAEVAELNGVLARLSKLGTLTVREWGTDGIGHNLEMDYLKVVVVAS